MDSQLKCANRSCSIPMPELPSSCCWDGYRALWLSQRGTWELILVSVPTPTLSCNLGKVIWTCPSQLCLTPARCSMCQLLSLRNFVWGVHVKEHLFSRIILKSTDLNTNRIFNYLWNAVQNYLWNATTSMVILLQVGAGWWRLQPS